MKIRLQCPECGGTNITSDATAAWDEQAQEWTLAGTQDHQTCEDCGHDGDYMAERVELAA